jgi:hypothetical protein
MIGFAILAAFFVAGLVIKAQQSSRFAKRAEDLDLTSVREAMVEKHGWGVDRAREAQREYVRFLTLLQMKPGFMLIPWFDSKGRDDLDQFWHQHILDTAKYAADCNTLFGQMIHHNPHVLKGSEQESDAAEKTRRLYTRTFKSGFYGDLANPADYSGSACGTATDTFHSGGGHGHGSDGGHGGHSCGGHSCGGHSCGGHGCGGGH